MTELQIVESMLIYLFLFSMLAVLLIFFVRPLTILKDKAKSFSITITGITQSVKDILNSIRDMKKMLIIVNERITKLEEGRRTTVFISEETAKIFNDYVREYNVFLSENKDINNMLYEIKRTYNNILGDIVAIGFDNIKTDTNLNVIFDAKQLIATKYKRKLFAYDKTNSVSGSLNLMLKQFTNDILVICKNNENGIRHNKFKILCVEFFDKIMKTVVNNLTQAAIHKIVSGANYEIAREAILSGNIELALIHAPDAIPNIKVLESRYRLILNKHMKTDDHHKELEKIESQIIAAIIDHNPKA